jgi:membrane-associated phospholipid phosphatase
MSGMLRIDTQRLSPMLTWSAFTKLADTVVLLPAAALCAAWLAWARAWRLALVWLLLLGFGLGVVAATKIAFVGWGIGSRYWNFIGISGHAMRAAAIAPVLCYLLAGPRSRATRGFALVLGFSFAVLIGLSRLVLQVHSPSEVVTGLGLGLAISAGCIAILQRAPSLSVPRFALLSALLPLSILSATPPAPTERWVDEVALRLSGHRKPHTRIELDYAPLAGIPERKNEEGRSMQN